MRLIFLLVCLAWAAPATGEFDELEREFQDRLEQADGLVREVQRASGTDDAEIRRIDKVYGQIELVFADMERILKQADVTVKLAGVGPLLRSSWRPQEKRKPDLDAGLPSFAQQAMRLEKMRDQEDVVHARCKKAWADYSNLKAEYESRPKGRPLWLRLAAVVLLAGLTAAAFLWGRREQPPPAAPPGLFRPLRLLGRGAMGEVFEAHDRALDRKVALKKLRPELQEDPRGLKLFMEAARLAASLEHPNIVRVFSLAREPEGIFLVMELVEGQSLQDILRSRERFPWKDAVRVLRQMAASIDYAHSRGVVHRDLKPGNVLIAPDATVKVTDFGTAYQAKSTIARVTRAGRWGSPPYMAPEQELGDTGRSGDLFALAVCFYEMLTGELPFTGPDFLTQKREGRIPPTGLGPGLDAMFAKALAADPGKRYASGAELLAAVEKLGELN